MYFLCTVITKLPGRHRALTLLRWRHKFMTVWYYICNFTSLAINIKCKSNITKGRKRWLDCRVSLKIITHFSYVYLCIRLLKCKWVWWAMATSIFSSSFISLINSTVCVCGRSTSNRKLAWFANSSYSLWIYFFLRLLLLHLSFAHHTSSFDLCASHLHV